ncbi:MAG: hypothetical protein ACT4QC_17320 [Planctomycetaceae bacterium]
MAPNLRQHAVASAFASLNSLGFWLCLFSAALLYALVVLSPRLVVWWSLREEFAGGQWRLVELERQVGRLQKFVAAQTRDEKFIREQAQAEFPIAIPGEQRIPVEPPLTLTIGDPIGVASARRPQRAAYPTVVTKIASSRRLADTLLATAAGLVLFAFSVLSSTSSRPPAE